VCVPHFEYAAKRWRADGELSRLRNSVILIGVISPFKVPEIQTDKYIIIIIVIIIILILILILILIIIIYSI